MLENYNQDKYGIIHQIKYSKFNYDLDYIHTRYDAYGELTKRMSHLRLGYIVGTINRFPLSILDVGYGNGDFLKTCASVGSKCYGYDVSNYPLPDNCKLINDIFSENFDVVTFFDSLEHCEDINFISKLNCHYIVISLPWCHYFSEDWFFEWKHRRENEHLHHFNNDALVQFMRANKFECLSLTNIEDVIRKPVDNNKNILSAIFQKI